MDHGEAVEQMLAMRYLLDELTPEAREAFEEHFFDCSECALDLRAGAAFMQEAKAQLPELTGALHTSSRKPKLNNPTVKRDWWLSWTRPAFAAPVFATLLLVLGYQNLVTYPALRAMADQPRLLSWAPLHGATRGGDPLAVTADRQHGVALPVDLPPQPSAGAYASFSFDLVDPQGKLVWTGVAAAPTENDSQRLTLAIPGAMLRDGTYTVKVSGVAAHGERTVIDQYIFNIHLTN
ncbi:MAG: zf-HC2 domain-containing protein [Terracidiphilus sp.]|jgi:hypothetical protein